MIRIKAFNSSLHNVSKKRLAQIQNGLYKPKKPKSINKISAKAKIRIENYRERCFEKWGTVCFLCGKIYQRNKQGKVVGLDAHHIDGRQNGDNPERIVPICNRFFGCGKHNHCGKDKRFYELKQEIERKLERLNNGNTKKQD